MRTGLADWRKRLKVEQIHTIKDVKLSCTDCIFQQRNIMKGVCIKRRPILMGRRTLVCWHETAVMVNEESTKEGLYQLLPECNISSHLSFLQDGCICLHFHCCALRLFGSHAQNSVPFHIQFLFFFFLFLVNKIIK